MYGPLLWETCTVQQFFNLPAEIRLVWSDHEDVAKYKTVKTRKTGWLRSPKNTYIRNPKFEKRGKKKNDFFRFLRNWLFYAFSARFIFGCLFAAFSTFHRKVEKRVFFDDFYSFYKLFNAFESKKLFKTSRKLENYTFFIKIIYFF